jgi:hypothetical protein
VNDALRVQRLALNAQGETGPLLRLITQALLVPIELHALAALVLGNFGFAFLFNGSHRVCVRAVLVKISLNLETTLRSL